MAIYLVEIVDIDPMENDLDRAVRWIKNGYVTSIDDIQNSEVPAKGYPVSVYNNIYREKLMKYRFTRLYECKDELDLKK